MTYRLMFVALMSAVATPALAQTAPAAQQPQPLAKTTVLQQLDAAFGNVDANKDGFTDRSEIEAAENRALAARKTQVIKGREAAFKQLDKDNNGQLSLAEFNAVVAAQALPKANPAAFLQRFDSNKDGKVSVAEHRNPAAAQFDRADTNKDGTLSVAEQRTLAATQRGGR
ncbi:EF-hand domain-containing protein [Sphingomonas mesophila]|uniref:EF-hand domain-containing protein n=1 Tax=Sphingomonas mesophila TaxID=2303576 RepID=UPI0013C31840|nr:EF-hand domain-containing protein [Sphingomonas mesophila]